MGEEETGRIVRKEAFHREISACGKEQEDCRKKCNILNKQESHMADKGQNDSGNSENVIKIALAHNQEDLAETMIHNLCRGTGLRGLCTMRPVDGEIIRPILCLSREKNSIFPISRTVRICLMNIPETVSAIIFCRYWSGR